MWRLITYLVVSDRLTGVEDLLYLKSSSRSLQKSFNLESSLGVRKSSLRCYLLDVFIAGYSRNRAQRLTYDVQIGDHV